MAGPTPVSALIHAATMVTAGVYMIARSFADLSRTRPAAMDVIAHHRHRDRVLRRHHRPGAERYQESLRLLDGLAARLHVPRRRACGAFSAGIYHLMTHAFFKALLFLGAGSVIHALSGEQDMRNMGGLRKKIPWTFWTMMCAAVAIAGVPPFSGFFSKDAILLAAHHHAPWMYWVGVDHRGHDRVLRVSRHVHDVLRQVSRPRASARIARRS